MSMLRRRLVAGGAAFGLALAGMTALAISAQAVGAVHFVDGGTGAPAATLGGYAMTPFAPDTRTPTGAGSTPVTTVPAPSGTLSFNEPVIHYNAGTDLIGGWGNGYAGDVYGTSIGTTILIMALPAGTSAFYFYAAGTYCPGTWTVTADTDNGTGGSANVTVDCKNNQANYFGFYTDNGSTITSIIVSVPVAAASLDVGEFGVAYVAPSITSANLATFYTAQPNSFTVTGFGNACIDPDPGPIPTSIEFDGQTQPRGICNGTAARTDGHPLPAAISDNGTTAPGTYHFRIYAVSPTDFSTQVYQDFTLTVVQSLPPAFTSVDHATFSAGTAGSFTVTTKVDAAHGTATLSCPSCVLPSGVAFTPGSGGIATIAGTPAAGSGGAYPLAIDATNTIGTTTQAFTLTVDEAPSLSGNASPAFAVGSSGSYTYTAAGYPGPISIDISSGTLPTGLSLGTPVFTTDSIGRVTTTVALQGHPDVGTGGTYPLQLVAANGISPDATLNLTITVYEAPYFTSADHATFVALAHNTFRVSAAGGYPTGPLTFSEAGALPAGVTLSSTGLLSGDPPVSASGYWPFTITVSNGHAPATQNFTLFVHAPKVRFIADLGGLSATTLDASGECLVPWTLTGFAPYAPVTVIAYPALAHVVPYDLGMFAANSRGRVTVSVCLPDAARGAYTLLAAGYALNGAVHYAKAQTIVQP